MRRKPISAAAAVALLALLPCAAGADAAAAAAAADGQPGPAVFNPMMGSWRRAPTTFDDPKLGTFRAVNNCELRTGPRPRLALAAWSPCRRRILVLPRRPPCCAGEPHAPLAAIGD